MRPSPSSPPPTSPRARLAVPAGPPYAGPDRRRTARQPHFVSGTLQPASGNADLDETVVVCNLSLGGVGLVCDHKYRLGTLWRITLGHGPLLLNAKVRVISCRPRADGRYDVGCQFS